MRSYERIVLLGAVFICLIICIIAGATYHQDEETRMSHIRSVIELKSHPDYKKSLVVGYNYHLLQDYAQSNGQTLDISISRDSSYLDSLKAGVIDILVLPYCDSLIVDGLLASVPVDSSSVWLMRQANKADMRQLNSWIEDLHKRDDFQRVRDAFIRRYDPARSRRRACISPYDDIIKAQADTLGWDWHFLAAVIYKESRFHIEALSHRGAMGLMQMMPSVAKHYGVDDPVEPEQSIRGGAHLLRDLSKLYFKVGADAEERHKFTLAAYNAGMGRIEDVLNLARHHNINTAYWDSVAAVFPNMRNWEVLDTSIVKYGPFNGVETLNYVDEVLDICDEFRRICP